MKLNANSMRQRLQKLEQYISELEKQQARTGPGKIEAFVVPVRETARNISAQLGYVTT